MRAEGWSTRRSEPLLVDLSHPLRPGMPSYPGLPAPEFGTFLAHCDAANAERYAPGTTFQIATYSLGGNTGTYVDAPFHRHPEGPDLSKVALERLANLSGLIVTGPSDGPVGPEAFADVQVSGKAVLVLTGWSERWGSAGYFRSGPFLTAEACHGLADAGAALVGIDCANVDDMADPVRPAHTILLAAGIPVVEHLRGLAELSGRRFRFFAVPPAVEAGTSFPVRAFALVEGA